MRCLLFQLGRGLEAQFSQTMQRRHALSFKGTTIVSVSVSCSFPRACLLIQVSKHNDTMFGD